MVQGWRETTLIHHSREESLYSCDFSPPFINYTRWVEPFSTVEGFAIQNCAYLGAYKEEESSGSEEEEEKWDDEGKDDKFYACCELNDLFESEEGRHGCCNYTSLIFTQECPLETFTKELSSEEQSHWLQCLGDGQNVTDCCVDTLAG